MSAELEPVAIGIVSVNVKVPLVCGANGFAIRTHFARITLLEARRIRTTSYHCWKADGRYIAHFDVTRRNGDHVAFFHNMYPFLPGFYELFRELFFLYVYIIP